MVDWTFTNKQRMALDHLQNYTAHWPDVNHSGVMSGPENELWSSVASRAYIWEVRLVCENFSGSKITDNCFFVLDEYVMRLNVSMADSQWMNIGQSSENLIRDQLNVKGRESFCIGLLNVVEKVTVVEIHNDRQILALIFDGRVGAQYLHHEFAVQYFHDLNLPVFVLWILIDLLYGYELTCFNNSALVDFPESSLSNQA